jgi:Nucleotidyltransferase domain
MYQPNVNASLTVLRTPPPHAGDPAPVGNRAVARGVRGRPGRNRRCPRGVTRPAPFGSTARGDGGPGSDVDLLIEEVNPESGFTLFDLVDLQDELAARRTGA